MPRLMGVGVVFRFLISLFLVGWAIFSAHQILKKVGKKHSPPYRAARNEGLLYLKRITRRNCMLIITIKRKFKARVYFIYRMLVAMVQLLVLGKVSIVLSGVDVVYDKEAYDLGDN